MGLGEGRGGTADWGSAVTSERLLVLAVIGDVSWGTRLHSGEDSTVPSSGVAEGRVFKYHLERNSSSRGFTLFTFYWELHCSRTAMVNILETQRSNCSQNSLMYPKVPMLQLHLNTGVLV